MKRTPLYGIHQALEAQIVPFAGFEMPIAYGSIVQEHAAVRKGVGIFDVSHMGQVFVGGPDSSKFLDSILTNDIENPPVGTAIYAHMTNEKGGVIDDLIVYKLSPGMNLLVVNASRIEEDWAWISSRAKNFQVKLSNESDQYGIIAVQGPRGVKVAACINAEIPALGKFKVKSMDWNHHQLIIARTGYTGEDGFEFIAENNALVPLWETLDRSARECNPFGPCGLGARDTLRLEAAYPLWGHELDESITPLEAGYGWVIKWTKEFTGKRALEDQKKSGVKRKIFGFIGKSAGPIARQGATIKTTDGREAGRVTSGSFSPTLGKPIALGFLREPFWTMTDFTLESAGRSLAAQRAKLPFYSNA